jgi:hypothetical protein
MPIVRQPSVFLTVLAAAVAAGCADYGGRMEVAGAVKLVGEPIQDGTIEFKPLEPGNQDTKGGAQIVKGEYKIPRKQGLKPGKYLISISSGDPNTPVNADEDFTPGPSRNFTAVDRVPEDWNVRSRHEVEVKADGPNKFDFDIPNFNPKYRPPKR